MYPTPTQIWKTNTISFFQTQKSHWEAVKQFFWGMLVGKNSNVGILMQTLYWYPPLQDRHFPEQSFLPDVMTLFLAGRVTVPMIMLHFSNLQYQNPTAFLCQIGHYFTQEFTLFFQQKKHVVSKYGETCSFFPSKTKTEKEHLRNHHLSFRLMYPAHVFQGFCFQPTSQPGIVLFRSVSVLAASPVVRGLVRRDPGVGRIFMASELCISKGGALSSASSLWRTFSNPIISNHS